MLPVRMFVLFNLEELLVSANKMFYTFFIQRPPHALRVMRKVCQNYNFGIFIVYYSEHSF